VAPEKATAVEVAVAMAAAAAAAARVWATRERAGGRRVVVPVFFV
jgi:hypothetical protein